MSSFFTYEEEQFKSEIEFLELEEFDSNANFKIPVWKPGNEQKCQEIVIMLNGFLEGVTHHKKDRLKWMIRYEIIAQKLGKENIASVLMPMPFHFSRCEDIEEGYAPIERLKESGAYFYFGGYTQVISDVEKLIAQIHAEPARFGLDVSDPEIHLLGYSLGGVVAIGSAIKLKEQKFKSLTVLLSSWNLSEIDPDAIEEIFRDDFDFGKEEWIEMLDELRNAGIGDKVFNQLVWGEGDDDIFGQLTWEEIDKNNEAKKCATRVLFIHGIEDEVFTRTMAASATSTLIDQKKYKHCSFIILPSRHSGVEARKQIAGYISNFISNWVPLSQEK